MGLYNSNRIRRAQGLCKPNRNKRTLLKCLLSSSFNMVVEKENSNPKKLHI